VAIHSIVNWMIVDGGESSSDSDASQCVALP
jgi:hypothetical protein